MNASFRGAAKVAMRSNKGNAGGNRILDQSACEYTDMSKNSKDRLRDPAL